jgi:nitric oxide reductase NorQ protein
MGMTPRMIHTCAEAAGSDALRSVLQRSDALAVRGLLALERRGIGYLDAGYPLHLRGPSGCGKTTLALRIAATLKRPILLLAGDASLDTGCLARADEAARTRLASGRNICNVINIGNQTDAPGLDRALALACAEGATLVYDAFTRAPAQANMVLLTVLEERLLVLPPGYQGGNQRGSQGDGYASVHPAFRAIFTSNPVDPVACRDVQAALIDRMITIDLDGFDRETEIEIAANRSGLPLIEAACIVDIVRDFRASREYSQRPTLRASVMIARLVAAQGLLVAADDPRFVQVCLDVLASKLKPDPEGLPDPRQRDLLVRLIDHFAGVGLGARRAA